ncbi:hypothetical protein PAXINDRAFT_157284 [Paxillus involutus ATCC 200175]|uniref:Serine protease n=1 Tax=Paxillus involutus ATCC 200175 TaxID=664439 RepID=A0A0C9TW24_PAXIN|nr:hypothetical protein PAXINDRAFT_157284 [Paxillus involutus ATCC 200175]
MACQTRLSLPYGGPVEEAHRPRGAARAEGGPICKNPIADVCDERGPQVPEYLDSVNVKWTTIDVTRFAEVEKDPGPVFLWVGMKPRSLSRENAEVAAVGCKELLKEFQITDVEVAFWQSLFTRSAGSQLFNYVCSVHAAADVRSPLTPALGLQIAARATPCFEGTGGIYICEGGESKRVFVLTARYIVFPPNAARNELHACMKASQPRHDVLLLGSKVFQDVLESIMVRIGRQAILVDHSPPISVGTGPKRFTEDWALIQLHGEKIDWEAFKGNVIDLDTKISVDDFILKMFPHTTARTSFKYPRGRLLQLRDVIKENELRHPTMLDTNGEECLLVVKNGNSTDGTIGRATGIMSFVRECFEDGTHETSMELAIYPYGNKDGAFSAPGDSGSIIADGKGRIVGLLTGGAGQTDSTDVSYATPFYWLFDERIKAHFPNAYLYPVTA